jgi:hypothetical protein
MVLNLELAIAKFLPLDRGSVTTDEVRIQHLTITLRIFKIQKKLFKGKAKIS